MPGYRQIFQTKFRDGAEATAAIQPAGWTYEGMKGLLRRYHLYAGVRVDNYGYRVDPINMRLRLHDNGAVQLFASAQSGIMGTTALPGEVWSSYDVFQHIEKFVNDTNNAIGPEGFLLRRSGHNYSVRRLRDVPRGGFEELEPPVFTSSSPSECKEWAEKAIRERKG